MRIATRLLMLAGALAIGTTAVADKFDDAIASFKSSPKSSKYFERAYGYAVFPEIGEATLVTMNASASAGTETSSAEASTTKYNAATGGGYNNGVAVFVVARGGLMAGIAVGGQKIKYRARDAR
jgi:lipid-binding SYLF domain-containing protein